MNFNKTESEAPASSPEVKPKPKPKPVPKPKPEMITKKQELPETSIRIATTTKPPPPVRRLSTPHKSPSPPPVPPARNYSRAPAPPPPKQSGPPNLDLELSSGWYAKTNGPLQLPKSISWNQSQVFVHDIIRLLWEGYHNFNCET